MAVGQNLHIRAFAEGVEIPVVAVNIQSAKNAPAAASIQIPFNDYGLDLKPRTLIHVFMYDIYNGAPPEEMVSVGGPGTRVVDRDDGVDPELNGLFPPERFESTTEQDLTDLENENYKLIFTGEVVGFNFSKTPTMRSIVLQCLDLSLYWDMAYQYQVSGMSLGGGGIRAAFTGASTTVFNSFLDGSGDIVVRLMATPPRTYPSLRGTLLGAITHIIEAIGGTYFGRRAIRGTNDHFSLAEARLHITQMLGANPFPERDEIRLMRAQGFGSLFSRSLAGLGKLVSVRQVLLALQRYIFHEIIPINAPRFIPALHDPALPRFETMGIEEDAETRPLARAARLIKARAEELKERQASSATTAEARRQSDLRGGLRSEIRQLVRTCTQAATRARRVGLQGGSSTRFTDFFSTPEVSRAFVVSGNNFNMLLDATRRGQRADVRTFTFYPPSSASANEVTGICTQIASLMQQVLESRHNRRIQRTTSQPDPPPRLITQIYRPDVWMVAPPRCNVFFPELYSQFSYGRNYQAEVTRLLLRTHSAFFGSDILFDNFYMAPSRILGARTGRPIGRGRVGSQADLSDAPAWVVRDMMDHELFTGIVPAFERMSDLNLHALRGGYTMINGVRVGYAQLACNHIFFQYRFRTRELMLQGKFNPYAVLGFPMLVIDKYLPQDLLREGTYDPILAARIAESVREGEGEIGPPSEERSRIAEANNARVAAVQAEILAGRPNTHYLGTPNMIVHSIDASGGGTTQVQMEYARTTNEKTEFLGDNVGHAGRARRTRNVRRTTVVACLEAPTAGSLGYYGGEIQEITDVTDQYQRRSRRRPRSGSTTRFASNSLVPLFVPDRRFTGRSRRGTRVPIGVELPASEYGPEVVALVGAGGTFDSSTSTDRDILVTFRAYRIVEQIGAFRTEDVELPPEDLTFPPWYGEHYRTNRIGGLYAYYFGTGAITDPLYVLEPGADPSQFDGAAASAAAAEVDAEGQQRAASIAYINRFTEIIRAAFVGSTDQSPQPGDSAAPQLDSGEQPGPPGEVAQPVDTGLIAEVRARSPIAEATEEIVRAYSRVKTENFDVHQFIRAYTWRPIASMVDLFGTANLEINDNGEVVRGREGFHSRAFGDFDDLRQLVNTSDGSRPQTILGLTTRDPDETGDDTDESRDALIAARLDTRKEKRILVLKYIFGLGASCGVLG